MFGSSVPKMDITQQESNNLDLALKYLEDSGFVSAPSIIKNLVRNFVNVVEDANSFNPDWAIPPGELVAERIWQLDIPYVVFLKRVN